MLDINKIMLGLAYCQQSWACNTFCPYYNEDETVDCPMQADALQALRDQSPVIPKSFATPETLWFHCGNCGMDLETSQYRFCPWCGKEIDWDGWAHETLVER